MANMLSVKVGSNTSRSTVLVPSTQTLRKTLEDANINYSTASVHLDGAPIGVGNLDKSFANCGITSSCYLIAVVKTDNAAK